MSDDDKFTRAEHIAGAAAVHEELGHRCYHDQLGDDCWLIARSVLVAAASARPEFLPFAVSDSEVSP